jgi:hypothetical protein
MICRFLQVGSIQRQMLIRGKHCSGYKEIGNTALGSSFVHAPDEEKYAASNVIRCWFIGYHCLWLASFDIDIAFDGKKRLVGPECLGGDRHAQCLQSTTLGSDTRKAYSIIAIGAASGFLVV